MNENTTGEVISNVNTDNVNTGNVDTNDEANSVVNNADTNRKPKNSTQGKKFGTKAPIRKVHPTKGRKQFFYRSVHFIPGTPEEPIKKWKVQVKYRIRVENLPVLFDTELEAHIAWIEHYKKMAASYEEYMKRKHGNTSIAGQLLDLQKENHTTES